MLLDTSVLLDLAKDPKDTALVQIIENLINAGSLSLIVPGIVFSEFLAGRDRVAADYARRLTPQFKIVKDAVQMYGGDDTTVQLVLGHLDVVEQEGARGGKLAAQVFRKVEGILRKFPAIDASDTVKARAFERSLQNRAPFHRGNNSVADAIIIELYSDEVRQARDDERLLFVTRNTSDFSADKENQKNPHPDYSCFIPGKSDYFINLLDALRSVNPVLVPDMLRAWELEQPTVGDLIRLFLNEVPRLGESHRITLARMSERPIGQKIAAKLRPRDVIDDCRERHEGGLAPSTVGTQVTYLRGVFAMAEEEWGTLGVFADVVDEARRQLQEQRIVSKSTERKRRLTPPELEQLFAYFRKQDAGNYTKIKMVDVMEFALATGRARGEIFSLRWGDFDPVGQACLVRRAATRRRKGDSAKPFPLRADAVRIILRQPRRGAEDPIFLRRGSSAGKRFIEAKKELGIDGLRFHDLRREAVMRMMESQVPLHQIESFSGLSLHMLERYRADLEAEKQGRA